MLKKTVTTVVAAVTSITVFASTPTLNNSVPVFNDQVSVSLPSGFKEVSHQKEKYRDIWAYENKVSEVDYTRYLVGGYKVNPYSTNKSFSVTEALKKEALACKQDFSSVEVPNGYVSKCGNVVSQTGVEHSVISAEKFVNKNGVNYAVKYFKYSTPSQSDLSSGEQESALMALALVNP